MYGDILTKYKNGTKEFKIDRSNVKNSIKNYVIEYIKNNSSYIKIKDIVRIYYCTDTDNCFLGDEDYQKNKSLCLNRLFEIREIPLSDKWIVPIEVIFFSNDLEHVLYNNTEKISDYDKKRLADKFGDDPEHFVRSFSNNNINVWETYLLSYEGIKFYQGRACNINVLINELHID